MTALLQHWDSLFEPDHYEYPIPGEPLIRVPVYAETVRFQLVTDHYAPEFE
jgi:hypothetical protein